MTDEPTPTALSQARRIRFYRNCFCSPILPCAEHRAVALAIDAAWADAHEAHRGLIEQARKERDDAEARVAALAEALREIKEWSALMEAVKVAGDVLAALPADLRERWSREQAVLDAARSLIRSMRADGFDGQNDGEYEALRDALAALDGAEDAR